MEFNNNKNEPNKPVIQFASGAMNVELNIFVERRRLTEQRVRTVALIGSLVNSILYEKEGCMKEIIKQQDLSKEFWTPEKCYITELSNTPEDPDASIARAKVEPGVTTRWHLLTGTIERYYIVSGRGSVEVGELPPQEVNPGDVVLIPPMCRQRITNTGSEDLIFLAICTPRFLPGVYEDIENNSSQKGQDELKP